MLNFMIMLRKGALIGQVSDKTLYLVFQKKKGKFIDYQSYLSKVKFHKSCLLFLLLAVLTGQFYLIFLSFFIIIYTRMWSFRYSLSFNWETKEITFYPFGGIARFASIINCPIIEELLVLVMGPLTQYVFYYF